MCCCHTCFPGAVPPRVQKEQKCGISWKETSLGLTQPSFLPLQLPSQPWPKTSTKSEHWGLRSDFILSWCFKVSRGIVVLHMHIGRDGSCPKELAIYGEKVGIRKGPWRASPGYSTPLSWLLDGESNPPRGAALRTFVPRARCTRRKRKLLFPYAFACRRDADCFLGGSGWGVPIALLLQPCGREGGKRRPATASSHPSAPRVHAGCAGASALLEAETRKRRKSFLSGAKVHLCTRKRFSPHLSVSVLPGCLKSHACKQPSDHCKCRARVPRSRQICPCTYSTLQSSHVPCYAAPGE